MWTLIITVAISFVDAPALQTQQVRFGSERLCRHYEALYNNGKFDRTDWLPTYNRYNGTVKYQAQCIQTL